MKSISFPGEALDLVRLPAAEYEQDTLLEWANPQLLSDDSSLFVNALPEICVVAGDIDPVKTCGVIQYRESPRESVPEQPGSHSRTPVYQYW